MIQLVALRGQGTTNVGEGGQKILASSLAWLFNNSTKVLNAIPEKEHVNVFYTLAAHTGADTLAKIIRTGKTFAWQEAIAWDIDGIDNSKHPEYITQVCAVIGIDRNLVTIVASGGGLHLIIFVNPIIRESAYFTKNKAHYNAICVKIDQALAEHKLPGRADPVVFEPARIFRLPGTINRKPGRADSKCVLLNLATTPVYLNLSAVSGLGDLERENIPLRDVKRIYPNPDLQEMMGGNGCAFMKWAFTKPEELHEPHAFDYYSILAQVPDGDITLVDAKAHSPRDLAQRAHDNATGSASLARQLFDAKWDQACRYGVRKCDTIATRFDNCNNCQHYGKIVTPLDLKGPLHIATKDQGYWVMNARGQHVHPHYGDLKRVFSIESPYIVHNGIVMGFDGRKYVHIPDNVIKAWVESKMKPSDPVKETHRIEALKKIAHSEVVAAEAADHLFEKSIHGKLNFNNGVMDIITGEFNEHSKRYGFKYCLPYDYDPDAISEYFMDWLETITLRRPEVMDMILDFMGYCLIPTYDDHCFLYLIGDGKNGKSTLIELITAMVGAQNISAVNIHQLTQNRFMPAQLEDKLVNLSDESSGKELTSEQLNILKNLSSGGELTVERKGVDGYLFRNRAKLIFSANKAPMFLETTGAVMRRLIVVPFDYTIEMPDPKVGEQLLKEVPGITAMLIRHARLKLAENGGRYHVSRGDSTGAESQKRILFGNSNISDWVDERVDIMPLAHESVITVADAYANYREWCEEAGCTKYLTRPYFGHKLRQMLPENKLSDLIRLAGKPQRVFRFIRWKA